MQYTNSVCATILLSILVCACSSNQSSESNRMSITGHVLDLSSIPKDGKLRDEHVRMYVSVKIKQEQLRFENLSLQKNLTTFEKAAIEHFKFNTPVYFWAKNIIDDTLINYTDYDANPRKSMSNIANPGIAHNLKILSKFKEDLQFAKNYRIKPKIITTSRSLLSQKPST